MSHFNTVYEHTVNQRSPVHITKTNHYRVIQRTKTHNAFYTIVYQNYTHLFVLMSTKQKPFKKNQTLKITIEIRNTTVSGTKYSKAPYKQSLSKLHTHTNFLLK